MENFWNTIHFFAYKFLNKLYMLSLKPAIWYFNSSLIKAVFKKNGRTPEMALKDFTFFLTDKRVGQSSFYALGIMIAMPFAFLFGLYDFYVLIFNSAFEIYLIVIFGLLSCLLNYFLLSRHDKYIKYFKNFEKQPREWKVKWAWISAGVILFPFLVLASSFIAMLPK